MDVNIDEKDNDETRKSKRMTNASSWRIKPIFQGFVRIEFRFERVKGRSAQFAKSRILIFTQPFVRKTQNANRWRVVMLINQNLFESHSNSKNSRDNFPHPSKNCICQFSIVWRHQIQNKHTKWWDYDKGCNRAPRPQPPAMALSPRG